MTKRELFNDVHFQSQSCDSVFFKFPYLPTELRQMIWSHSLRRRRWIPLRVVLPTDYLSYVDYGQSREKYLRTPYYGARNSLGKIISGWDYHLAVDKEDSTLSPLFGVSSEARQIALEFYRVRVPVRQCLSLSSGRDLRLNPEYDVVFLKWAYRSYLIAYILHDIKAHDPQDVGVVHLALNEGFCDYLDKLSCESPDGFPDIKYGLSLSTLHQVARESLAEMVRSKIQSIFYMVNFLWDRVWNPVAGISHPLTGTPGSGLFMLHHARGRPLDRHLDSATFFDWLPRDPRPVDADLGMVRLWDDPHRLSEWWTRLEALFGADGWWQTHPRPDFYLCPSTRSVVDLLSRLRAVCRRGPGRPGLDSRAPRALPGRRGAQARRGLRVRGRLSQVERRQARVPFGPGDVREAAGRAARRCRHVGPAAGCIRGPRKQDGPVGKIQEMLRRVGGLAWPGCV